MSDVAPDESGLASALAEALVRTRTHAQGPVQEEAFGILGS
ncbi:hypothetical protein [Paraburkholderia atlantica]|uniref:Uncharacterized protein n=1 Tax=Paraburkholderia atlantica TaxID=2654982 RepID=A0A7W8Q4F0_PARAM|nr:hypothetical protein [Paraburkholderia atlantica]MBB5423123.1 hypothetical protein [Paraburkholderia atlantica]